LSDCKEKQLNKKVDNWNGCVDDEKREKQKQAHSAKKI